MHKILSSYAYFYLNQIFSLPERYIIHSEFEKVFEKNLTIKDCSYMEFNKFFSTEAKLTRFKNYYIELGINLKDFKANVLGGIMHRPEETFRGITERVKPLFSEGVEIYKGRPHSVNGIAINYCRADQMALTTTKGSREVNIRDSLQYRRRTLDGLKLLDEESDDWVKELIRLQESSHVHDERLYPSFVTACLEKLKEQTTQNSDEFSYFEAIQAKEWCQRDCNEFFVVTPSYNHRTS